MLPRVPQFVQCEELALEAEVDDRSIVVDAEEATVPPTTVGVVVEPDEEVGQGETVRRVAGHRLPYRFPLGRRSADELDQRIRARRRRDLVDAGRVGSAREEHEADDDGMGECLVKHALMVTATPFPGPSPATSSATARCNLVLRAMSGARRLGTRPVLAT